MCLLGVIAHAHPPQRLADADLRHGCVTREWCTCDCHHGIAPRKGMDAHACVSRRRCLRCPHNAVRSHVARWWLPGGTGPTRAVAVVTSSLEGVHVLSEPVTIRHMTKGDIAFAMSLKELKDRGAKVIDAPPQ